MPARRLERDAVVTVPVLLTVAHVGEILDCAARTVERRMDEGLLPFVIEGGKRKVRGDELLAYIEGLERKRPSPTRTRRKPRANGRFDFLGAGGATLDGSIKSPGAADTATGAVHRRPKLP